MSDPKTEQEPKSTNPEYEKTTNPEQPKGDYASDLKKEDAESETSMEGACCGKTETVSDEPSTEGPDAA